jgi:hypothetical protein
MSCLFNSFSKFVDKTPDKIRQEICDFLALDIIGDDIDMRPSMIAKLDGLTLEEYIRRMRQPHTWGGALEIAGFVNIYNLNVNVINIRDRSGKKIEFVNPNNTKTIEVTWNGGHYEPK